MQLTLSAPKPPFPPVDSKPPLPPPPRSLATLEPSFTSMNLLGNKRGTPPPPPSLQASRPSSYSSPPPPPPQPQRPLSYNFPPPPPQPTRNSYVAAQDPYASLGVFSSSRVPSPPSTQPSAPPPPPPSQRQSTFPPPPPPSQSSYQPYTPNSPFSVPPPQQGHGSQYQYGYGR